MKIKSPVTLILVLFLSGLIGMQSCKKDDPAADIDNDLYTMAKETNGFTWYKFSDAMLDKSAGSGHNYPFFRTRYNALAAGKLDSAGKIMTGITFADGSLIVKELYADANTLTRYAILYKDAGNEHADAKGWVWGYINADGSVAESATNKGSACISCHAQAGNIDYMLMNVYFP